MANCDFDRPVDRALYSGPGLHVGSFRLPAHHPHFDNTGPISGNLLVFPRSAVTITHFGGPTVHADANVIMLYNIGQEYRRGLIDPRGDFSDYFHFDQSLLEQAISVFDPSVHERPGSPFCWTHTPCAADVYFRQRAIVRALRSMQETNPPETILDDDEIREALYGLLEISLRGIAADRLCSPLQAVEALAKKQRTLIHHREQIRVILAHLYLHYDQPESIEQIAAIVDLSAFHLSRMFAHHTGQTIHAYRNQLRLRRALEMLESGNHDVTTLALQLGYASHSHFGQAFRRAFGIPPSQLTRQAARQLLKQTRT